jgi:NTE family protein
MRVDKKLRWALVLSGGGAKGIAHVGVLKALAEFGAPEPSLIVGTSMGAIVGGLYACGMDAAELERYVLEDFDIRRYLDSRAFRIDGPVGKLFQTGQMLGNLATRPGMDSGRKILELLEEKTQGKTFDQTRIPFRCNAVDLLSGKELVLSAGSVARAVRASLSFPAFFEPLVEGDQHLVDGGLVNNLPVRIAREAGYKKILAVDVGIFQISPPSALKNVPQIMYRALEVAIHHIELGDEDTAGLTLKAYDGTSPFAFARARQLIALGERTFRENLPAVQDFFAPGFRAALRLRRRRNGG